DYNHSDLASNLWISPAGFSVQFGGRTFTCPAGTRGFNTIKRNCEPMDDNRHGTQVAGIIGAQGNNAMGISGVNWTASMLPVKFLDAKGTGTTSNAIDAIEFAIQLKSANQANVRVLNASWGDAVFSKALMQAVEHAFQNDILLVAAAGNLGGDNDSKGFYPASYALPNVMSVASTNHQDALDGNSNFGANSVHLGAPGTFILSTIPGNSYLYNSGTSMAAAYVSGSAALALSICPDLGTADLRAILLQSVVPTAALAGKTTTQGRLNVGNAVQACNVRAFALSANPQSLSVARAESSSVTIQVNPVNGYTGDITLQISGLPPGVSASSASVNTSGAASLTITVNDSAAVGTYSLTVLGSDGFLVRSTPVWLEVLRRRR
ncbi:MAG: S8 family peptidase, partial [Burkholderiales bacterium]